MEETNPALLQISDEHLNVLNAVTSRYPVFYCKLQSKTQGGNEIGYYQTLDLSMYSCKINCIFLPTSCEKL